MHADLMSSNPLDLPYWTKIFCIKSCFLDYTWKGGSNVGNESFFFLYCDIWIYLQKRKTEKNMIVII